jgi:GTPase
LSDKVLGNIKGLSPSEIKQLTKLYHRRVDADSIIPFEVARELCTLARAISRRIGLIINREGEVVHVVVGSKDILYLPDLGRSRQSSGRLRRLRLVFTDLSKSEEPAIPQDILTDLEKLRLDLVAGIKITRASVAMKYAHLSAEYSSDNRGHSGSHVSHLIPDLGREIVDLQDLLDEIEADIASETSSVVKDDSNRALLVGVYPPQHRDPKGSIEELEELARTAGVEIADKIIQQRRVDPRTLLGKGKLEETELTALKLDASMLIFDTELRPAQWRVITNTTSLKVLDRSMLILDIFAQRASSSDGRLQVELAQLKYNLPRLVEKDAGLSRLSGGIGGRGPGETKLEIGRRRIRDRITLLEKQLTKIGDERELRRQKRSLAGTPLVAILGYTNVGKSTLFNALTKSDVLAENKLFATLEPSQRRMYLHNMDGESHEYRPGKEIVLSDTVGFIRDLPEELVNAFKATLEELYSASLLIHVVDGSSPVVHAQHDAVLGVLADMELSDVPRITIVNKVDQVSQEDCELLCRDFDGIGISAANRSGLKDVMDKIQGFVMGST